MFEQVFINLYLDFCGINTIMEKVKDMDPKKMDQKKLRYIFRRILSRIKEKPKGFFKFRKMRGVRGLWHWGDLIEIDHRKEIVPTIVHEVLHDLYQEKSEKWIRQVESKVSQILKPYDVFSLMSAIFEKLDMERKKRKNINKKV
jgi:hypothetical protein